MTVMVIAIVGACIAMAFFYMNKEAAEREDRTQALRSSTAMVFMLSIGVMLVAHFFGASGSEAQKDVVYSRCGAAGGASVVHDYVLCGEPPF